jgi:hypothetical protein
MEQHTMKAARLIVLVSISLGGCADLSSGPEGNSANLNRYVAMGSSVSMGVASDGVVAETQRQSWPALLAADVGVEFALPLIQAPGCRAPIVAPLANMRRADNTLITDAGTCAANDAGVSLPAQNLALSGATARDAAETIPHASRPLYARVLRPSQSQLTAMQAMNPSFVSVEFGANELLPALSGLVSDLNTSGFGSAMTSITNIIRQNTAAKAVYALLPADLRKFPAIRTSAEVASQRAAFVTRNVSVNANCDASPNYVSLHGKIIPALIEGAARAAAGQGPADLSCADVPDTRDGILTEADFTIINNTAAQINGVITNRAASGGFATFSLGALYDTAKDGAPFNLQSLLTSTTPFGPLISLDGIHPSAAGQAVLAAAAKAGIIQTYGGVTAN